MAGGSMCSCTGAVNERFAGRAWRWGAATDRWTNPESRNGWLDWPAGAASTGFKYSAMITLFIESVLIRFVESVLLVVVDDSPMQLPPGKLSDDGERKEGNGPDDDCNGFIPPARPLSPCISIKEKSGVRRSKGRHHYEQAPFVSVRCLPFLLHPQRL